MEMIALLRTQILLTPKKKKKEEIEIEIVCSMVMEYGQYPDRVHQLNSVGF